MGALSKATFQVFRSAVPAKSLVLRSESEVFLRVSACGCFQMKRRSPYRGHACEVSHSCEQGLDARPGAQKHVAYR